MQNLAVYANNTAARNGGWWPDSATAPVQTATLCAWFTKPGSEKVRVNLRMENRLGRSGSLSCVGCTDSGGFAL